MTKRDFEELTIQKDLIKPQINSNRQGKVLLILIAILVLLGLIVGAGITIVFIGLIVAFIVIAHTSIKLSAIFRPWSKTFAEPNPNYKPFVSIHVTCKIESAELVNKTVEALTKLDYPNYEVIVIHSNNQDIRNWLKIQKFVESCGENFKFVHLDKVDGFKAGALNYLNSHIMDERVEVVAIIDCDYIVTPNFLKETVGYFRNPEVGIVQAPQDYHNVNPYNIGLAYEYRSFFALVMHQAQRLNLVSFTGTMGLIRADLMKKGLKWNEWCITEDTEAGVYINSIGFRGVYVDKSLGKGLMPLDYVSLIKQRQRWVYGNMQILGKNFLSVIRNQALSIKQKFAFLAQLVTWFDFELIVASIYLGLSITRLLGYSGMYIAFTNTVMLILLAISLISNFLYFMIGLRKEASVLERFRAFWAHYGLLYVMSSGWLLYFFGHQLGFNTTKKEKTGDKIPFRQYSNEFIIIVMLLVGLGLEVVFGHEAQLDMFIILTFVIIELMGILYLRRAFVKSNRLNI